jgi:carboxypeptidase C (cathepsin A)
LTEEKESEGMEQKSRRDIPEDILVETHHSFTIDGKEIHYKVTTGTLILKEEREKKEEKPGVAEGEVPAASIFFIAYTLEDDDVIPSTRPLTFSFNGGPGSSSVWLHLGVLGPRRVWMGEKGDLPAPPYKLVDNEYSLLDVTDLVFIDPVSTGYSRPVVGEKAKDFHDFKKDIESVGDFIRLYASRFRHWNSPKFLIGESYGTTRAAGLSGYLGERLGMYLNGIMLISSVLDFQTLNFVPGNDIPPLVYLPTYAAIAWYHGQLNDDLQADLSAALDEVEAFTMGDYALALLEGAALAPEKREQVAAKLASYTGLSQDYILGTDLRIEIFRFTKELLRREGRTVGRLDSRFKGYDRDSVGENPEYDPSLTNIIGPYTATFNDYVRSELEFESDLPYEILSPRVSPWSYSEYENKYVNVAETLRKAIITNPYMQIFVANGYYDLATPYFATEYTFNHMGLPEELRANIRMRYYEAGHMMYIHTPSLADLKADLAEFIREAVG